MMIYEVTVGNLHYLQLIISLLLLSQLSRGVEARQDRRPMMSDLRESRNIEQDADTIAFLNRDDYYSRQSVKQSQIEVILAKQRNGPTGTVELGFEIGIRRFRDLKEHPIDRLYQFLFQPTGGGT